MALINAKLPLYIDQWEKAYGQVVTLLQLNERNNNVSLSETKTVKYIGELMEGDRVTVASETYTATAKYLAYSGSAGYGFRLDNGRALFQADLEQGKVTVTRKREAKVGDILTGDDLAAKNFKRGTVLRYQPSPGNEFGNLRVRTARDTWLTDGFGTSAVTELDRYNHYKVVYLP